MFFLLLLLIAMGHYSHHHIQFNFIRTHVYVRWVFVNDFRKFLPLANSADFLPDPFVYPHISFYIRVSYPLAKLLPISSFQLLLGREPIQFCKHSLSWCSNVI